MTSRDEGPPTAVTHEQLQRCLDNEMSRLKTAAEQRFQVEEQIEEVRLKLGAYERSHPPTVQITSQDEHEFVEYLKDSIMSILGELPAKAITANYGHGATNHIHKIEERLKLLTREAVEYTPEPTDDTEPPFDESAIEEELHAADDAGASGQLITETKNAVKDAMVRFQYALEIGIIGSAEIEESDAEAWEILDIRAEWIVERSNAGIAKAAFEAVRFHLTDTYSFNDLAQDAARYWRIKDPHGRVRCWDVKNGQAYEPNLLVRDVVAKLPPEERKTVYMRTVPDVQRREEIMVKSDLDFEAYQMMQAQQHVTPRDRAKFLENILYQRQQRRWRRRMCLRATVHYTFTVLFAIMLCIDPNRGYFTAKGATRPLLDGFFSFLRAGSEQRITGTEVYYQNDNTTYYTELTNFTYNMQLIDPDASAIDFYLGQRSRSCASIDNVEGDYLGLATEFFRSVKSEVTNNSFSVTVDDWPFYYVDMSDPEPYYQAPGRWAELGEGFTNFTFLGPLATWKHRSFLGYPNVYSLARVKDIMSIRAFLATYLMDVLVPRCTYGGQAINYWDNSSINLTGVIGDTNNLVNPLRLFQTRRLRINCSSSSNSMSSYPQPDADTLRSVSGVLKDALDTIHDMFGIVRFRSGQAPACYDGSSTDTYGNSFADLSYMDSYGDNGFSYTSADSSNQEEICSHKFYGIGGAGDCYGPGGFIRDIWAASDYRSAVNELMRGDWIDEDTDTVVVRIQTFNPQTGCYVFSDIIFPIDAAGVVRPELVVRTSCQHTSTLHGGETIWATYHLPPFFVVVYVLSGIYLLVIMLSVLLQVGRTCRSWYWRFRRDRFDGTWASLWADAKASDHESSVNTRFTHRVTDICQLVLFIGVFWSMSAHMIVVERTIERKGNFENTEFVDLSPLADSDMIMRGINSLMIFSLCLKCVGYLEVHPALRTRFGALWNAGGYVLAMFALLLHLICAFCVLGGMLYGPISGVFANFGLTAMNYLQLIVGDTRLIVYIIDMVSYEEPVYQWTGIIFAFILIVLFVFFGTALIVAIEGEAWSDSTVIITRRHARQLHIKQLKKLSEDTDSTDQLLSTLARLNDASLKKLTRKAGLEADKDEALQKAAIEDRYSRNGLRKKILESFSKKKQGNEDAVPVNLRSAATAGGDTDDIIDGDPSKIKTDDQTITMTDSLVALGEIADQDERAHAAAQTPASAKDMEDGGRPASVLGAKANALDRFDALLRAKASGADKSNLDAERSQVSRTSRMLSMPSFSTKKPTFNLEDLHSAEERTEDVIANVALKGLSLVQTGLGNIKSSAYGFAGRAFGAAGDVAAEAAEMTSEELARVQSDSQAISNAT